MQNLKNKLQATESYEEIALTDEEIQKVLQAARRDKYFAKKNAEYAEKIRQAPQYRTFTAERLYEYSLNRIIEQLPDFVVDEANETIIKSLACYFSGDSRCESYGISLSKGIMLLGPVGCGKTTIMRMFSINSYNAYSVVSCKKVSEDFTRNGADSIDVYSNLKPVYAHHYFGQTGIGMCFDDLGTEEIKKHFGNVTDTMGDIIFHRYDNPALKAKTHFTGNITGEDIEQIYGSRIRSRLREMVNVISFSPESIDRRL